MRERVWEGKVKIFKTYDGKWRNFREFSRFRDFFQEIREYFSHEKYFLPPFAKINPREKLEIGQFAK